jgi:antitoxin component YwqK of YwqJK toxin-antitoxin module
MFCIAFRCRSVVFSVFILLTLVACGGGSDSPASNNETPEKTVTIGAIPEGVNYTIDLNGQTETLDQLAKAEPSVSVPFAAYNGEDLIYWGNGLVHQATGAGLDGRSTAIMLIYSLMITEPMPDFAQVTIISAINNHPLINDIADSLTQLVETYGYMNLDAIDSTTQDNIKTVITDVRQQLIDSMSGSNTIAKKIGAVELDTYGAILTQQGTLTVSKLKFSEASNQVLVDMSMNNRGKWYYETSVVDDPANPTYKLTNVFNIPPRKGADLLDSAWGLLGILTGADQTVTELQLSSSVDINYQVPKITTIDVAANRHYLVANPHSPYAIFVNTLNAAAPLIDTIGLPKFDGKALVDPTSKLSLAFYKLIAAQPNERFDAASTVTDEFIKWVIKSAIKSLPSNTDPDSTPITRKLKWFEKVNKIGSAIKTLASVTEYIAAVNDLNIKTFEIDPVPITITNVTNNGNNNYSVTVKLWGNDVVNATGDDTVELKVLGYRSITTMPVGSASINQNPDYIQTFSFTNTEATPTFTFDVTFPDNGIYWISVIPGTDAPCLSSTVCSDAGRTSSDNYLYPEQYKADRNLVLLDRNLKPICNGDYDTSTGTCWQEIYYANGEVQRRTPYVNGLRQGVETYYPKDSTRNYYIEVPYEIVQGVTRQYDQTTGDLIEELPMNFSVVSGNVKRHEDDGTLTTIPYRYYTGRVKWWSVETGIPGRDDFQVRSIVDGDVVKTSADGSYKLVMPVSSFQDTEKDYYDDTLEAESPWVRCGINGTVTVTENGKVTHEVPFIPLKKTYFVNNAPVTINDHVYTHVTRGYELVPSIDGIMKVNYPNGNPKLYAEMTGLMDVTRRTYADSSKTQLLQQSNYGNIYQGYPIISYYGYDSLGVENIPAFINWDKSIYDSANGFTYLDTPVWSHNSAASGSVKTYYDTGAKKAELTFEPFINSITTISANGENSEELYATSKLTGTAKYYYANGQQMLQFSMDPNLSSVNSANDYYLNTPDYYHLDTKMLGYYSSRFFDADYLPSLVTYITSNAINLSEVSRTDITGAKGQVLYWYEDGTQQLNYNVSTYKDKWTSSSTSYPSTSESLTTVPDGAYSSNYADGYSKGERNFQAGQYSDGYNTGAYSYSVHDVDHFDFEYSPGKSVQFEGGYVVNVDSTGAQQLKDGLHTYYNANGTKDREIYYSSGTQVWSKTYNYNPDGSLQSVTTTGNPSG